MRISHLKIIRDISKTKSISRAAGINSISQSAASQLVQQLEKQLNIELFDRTKRPLQLTMAGKLYDSACRDIIRRYGEMESQLEALRQELAGTIRVASIYSIGLYQMARMKEHFERRHTNVQIHLEYMRPDKVYQAVTEDQVDLGLVSYPNPSKDLKIIPWRMESMVLVCHPSHDLARKRSIKPADLENKEFVSFDPDLSIRKALDRFFREQGIHRKIVLEFDNIQMIKEALVIGSGISILPERTVRHEAIEGRLVALPLETDGLERPIGIVHRRTKKFSPAIVRFLNFLQETTPKSRR
ncbi:MAG: LysR family transcriptional regulator [Solibacterales bacterium]|nr:LysR family transcriptional regulator [Bryobacterales bacterium]|tara:strand:+ start:2499 stop:3395 length:897 start_codon:yes stop_codon:yes gene_type:complete